MSQTYDNTNRGAAFVNKRKEKETQPDLTGKINVNGVDYRLSIWKQESPKVGKYLSMAVSEFEEKVLVDAVAKEEAFF